MNLPFPVEHMALDLEVLIFILAALHLATKYKVYAPGLKRPRGQYHVQKARMKSCGSKTGLPAALG